MARQGIGTGSSPNDGTGDNLRTAGGKINDNFSEIYTHFGDGTDLTTIVGTGIATASGLVGTGATILDFRGSVVTDAVVSSGIATINFLGDYTDSDVDAHLNTSTASANEVLSWTGSDYDWVAQSGGGGGLSEISDDTTPQLGGELDLNGFGINGTGIITATTFSGTATNAGVATVATYTSQWTLGADGSNNYTFTGPGFTGAESDPALYLTRGHKYTFYNNSGGHPFRIQSTPNGESGTVYNDGILSNDVDDGSTLVWDVQFDAPNKLYYQCTSHPNMGGPIYILPRTEPAVGVRTEVSGTTGSVGAAATTNLDITGLKSYGLLKVGISSAAWVRLYVDEASRTSDENRSYLTDPSPGSGLIAEVRTETAGISTFLMTPGVIGWNNDVSVGSTIYSAVTNNESSAATITVDLTVVKMED